MKKRSRKIFAGAMALMLMFTAVSCGDGQDSSEQSEENSRSSAAEQSNANSGEGGGSTAMNNSYRADEIACDVAFQNVYSIDRTTSGYIMNGYVQVDEEGMTEQAMCIADSDFTTFKKLDFSVEKPENGDVYYNMAVSPSGDKIFIMSCTVDYGDYPAPDYDDPDFNAAEYDFDAREEAAVYTYKMYTLDTEGNIQSENEIQMPDEFTSEDDRITLNTIYPLDEDSVLVNAYSLNEEGYYKLSADGTVGNKFDFGENTYFDGIFVGADGFLNAIFWGNNGPEVRKIDPEAEGFGEVVVSADDFPMMYGVAAGTGDYIFYTTGSTTLTGVKSDGSCDEIINWVDSDINGDYINCITALDNGDFVIFMRSDNGNGSLCRVTKRDPSDVSSQKVLTLAVTYADTMMTNIVTKFNKSNENYRIKIKDYSEYYEYDETAEKTLNSPQKQLQLDIASGNAPDMIVSMGGIEDKLAASGYLVDLYQYMGSNGTVSKDDILPNIIETAETDGKLYTLPVSFNLSTVACKKKFYDSSNWTFEDLKKAYEELPDGMELSSAYSRQAVYNLCMMGESFVDYENATCSYNSPEYVEILEFANQFPDQKDIIDWETATDEEMQSYYNEQEVAYLNDKALLKEMYISDPIDYKRTAVTEMGEDISIVGYPSSNNTGGVISFGNTLSILSTSSDPEGCWQFVSGFFAEDYQNAPNGQSMIYDMPVVKSAFDSKIEDSKKKPYYINDKGEKEEYDNTYYINGEQVTVDPLTDEEAEYVKNLLTSVKRRTNAYDMDIEDIISEETDKFFAGESDAQSTADSIQNRVSIMLSENS